MAHVPHLRTKDIFINSKVIVYFQSFEIKVFVHLHREMSRRLSKQIPKPPLLAPLNVDEQQLYSKFYPHDRDPHPLSRGVPPLVEETHFNHLTQC